MAWTLAIVAVLGIGLKSLFGPMLTIFPLALTDLVPGDLGDARLNHLILEHGFKNFGQIARASFWSPDWQFYPARHTLKLSENLLSSMPIYGFLRLIQFSALQSYQLWMISCAVLNFISMYLSARLVKLGQLGAILAAYVFAFSLPRVAHSMHSQNLPHFFSPICLILFYTGVTSGELSKRRVCIVLASLFMMLQIWASVYLGWFLVLTLVIGSSIFLMQKKGRQDFKRLLGDPGLLVGLVILCIFGILPFLGIYAAGETVDRRIWYDIRHTLPTFASYLAAPDGSMLYHQLSLYKLAFLSSIPYQDLTPLFMGFIPAFILFYWLWKAYDNFKKKRSFQPFQGFLLKLLLLLFLLSFCFYKSVSFWQIIYGIVPGAGNIRGVSRYFLVMLIPYGFLIGYFVSNISMRLLAWCLLFGVMLENYNLNIGAYSNQAHLQRVQTVKIALAKVLVEKSCDAFYWNAEGEFYSVQLDAMWASLETGIPSLNGYSGGTPKNWSFTGFYQDQGRLQEMTETWLHEQEKPRVRVCLLPEA